MSRIGKNAVNIPEKVEVKVDSNLISVKGPKGSLTTFLSDKLLVTIDGKKLSFTAKSTNNSSKSLWGMTRTLVSNMMTGVTTGFSKDLEFNGVGYRAAVSGNVLNLSLGFSHPIDYKLPDGIEAKVVKNTITISGSSKELVGLVCAQIRDIRPPEPYKGKGIRYANEKVLQKAGKTGAKK